MPFLLCLNQNYWPCKNVYFDIQYCLFYVPEAYLMQPTLFISLFIYKLFGTNGCMGLEGVGGVPPPQSTLFCCRCVGISIGTFFHSLWCFEFYTSNVCHPLIKERTLAHLYKTHQLPGSVYLLYKDCCPYHTGFYTLHSMECILPRLNSTKEYIRL
jgi:hypothetical protein